MAVYYVAREGQTAGPFGFEAMQGMAQAGSLSASSLVWTAGMSDWAAAHTIAELQPMFAGAAATEPAAAPSPPPPRPPLTAASAPIGDDQRLRIGQAFAGAFAILRARPGQVMAAVMLAAPLVVVRPLLLIIGVNLRMVEDGSFRPSGAVGLVMVVWFLVSTVLYGGLCRYMIDAHEGAPTRIGRVLAGFARPLALITAGVLIVASVIAGLMLFVLPGVFLSVAFMLTPFILVDSGLGPMAAMVASYRAVMQLGWWRCCGLFAGMIAIGIGAFVAVAIVTAILSALLTQENPIARGLGLIVETVINLLFSGFFVAAIAGAYAQARANQARRPVTSS